MTRVLVMRKAEAAEPDERVPDALIGAAAVIVERIAGAGRLVARVAAPGARLVLDPPLIPLGRRPARLVEALAQRGRLERDARVRTLEHVVAAVVPAVVHHLAELVPLTELIRQSVDLDVLVADVDLDAVASRIDLDPLAARIDVEAILDRVDLNEIVKERLDLNAVVRTVDIDSIIDRIDLVALANEVIDEIDLPYIIRQSSGSLASESVRNVRIQSIEADRAVERVIDRFRLRRHLGPDGQLPSSPAT
jgi:hypothetical protein